MPISTKKTMLYFVVTLLALSALALYGCSALKGAGPASPDSGEDVFEEIDLSGASEEADTGEEGSDQSGSSEDIPTVMGICPKDPMAFVLFLSHTWNFSPNRQLESMKVDGQTEPSSPCPFTVAGSTVLMEQCRVPITNTGFIKGDDGTCQISTSGAALISIEDASCKDGVITMTIVEAIDPDAGSGTMTCPKVTEPYFPFYPLSRTTRSFTIQVGGDIQTEVVDPDLTGQFMYMKEWTIHGEGLGSPLPE
jgi:hypothetical protein